MLLKFRFPISHKNITQGTDIYLIKLFDETVVYETVTYIGSMYPILDSLYKCMRQTTVTIFFHNMILI